MSRDRLGLTKLIAEKYQVLRDGQIKTIDELLETIRLTIDQEATK